MFSGTGNDFRAHIKEVSLPNKEYSINVSDSYGLYT